MGQKGCLPGFTRFVTGLWYCFPDLVGTCKAFAQSNAFLLGFEGLMTTTQMMHCTGAWSEMLALFMIVCKRVAADGGHGQDISHARVLDFGAGRHVSECSQLGCFGFPVFLELNPFRFGTLEG